LTLTLLSSPFTLLRDGILSNDQIDTLDIDDAKRAWAVLSQHVVSFANAWQAGHEPRLTDFCPEHPPAIRRLVLIELAKLDIKHRHQRGAEPKPVEAYVAEYPELAGEEGPPCDLIYEEFRIRRLADPEVDIAEYYSRFPRQASTLERMLDAPNASSTLCQEKGPPRLSAGQQIDDFDLLTLLGQGAFGQVFLARQRSMQRLVALKISADRGNEPQTMAQLDHPQIVRVYDQRLLPERGQRLLYMQYIPGGTLQAVIEWVRRTPPADRSGMTLLAAVDQALREAGQEPPADSRTRQRLAALPWPAVVCWIGARVAQGLSYAHKHGVLHRDIKPANVLVAGDCSPLLADFNISYSSKVQGATPAAYFGGSLAYMSPEQLEAYDPRHDRRAEELDGRSDIFSLGVLLWELLTGRRPFEDESLDEGWSQVIDSMIDRRRTGIEKERLSQLPADAPPELERIFSQCLAPDADGRFASADDLARELELCLQPQVQRLLRPATGGWRRQVCRSPWPTAVLLGVAPNALASGFNIRYNWTEIIHELDTPAQEVFQNIQLAVVNVTAYTVGLTLAVVLAWPVLNAVKALAHGRDVGSDRLPALRNRCLWLGDYVAWIGIALWIVSGAVFPIWLQTGTPDAQLKPHHYAHFITSQGLCGVIAATGVFFLLTSLAVRVYYPLLLRPDLGNPSETAGLAALSRRTSVYFAVAMSVPFLALIPLAFVDLQMPIVFVVLGLYGVASFALLFWLWRKIQQDLQALAVALNPEVGYGAASESIDSVWSSSR
jgi:serine/threonine protein kinase